MLFEYCLQDSKESPLNIRDYISRYYNKPAIKEGHFGDIYYKPSTNIQILRDEDDVLICILAFEDFMQQGNIIIDKNTDKKINIDTFLSSTELFLTQHINSDNALWYQGERFPISIITNNKDLSNDYFINEGDLISSRGRLYIKTSFFRAKDNKYKTWFSVPEKYDEYIRNSIGLFVLTYIDRYLPLNGKYIISLM